MKILIVENEISIAKNVKGLLEEEEFTVDFCLDGNEGLKFAKRGDYDLLLLDIVLPGMNGIVLLQRLRELDINTPVIMLTAKADTKYAQRGFESGCDDYIKKPFTGDELLMRIRAVLRRARKNKNNGKESEGIILNSKAHQIKINNSELKLTNKEYLIMEFLLKNIGEVKSKKNIINSIWGEKSKVDVNSVEVHINAIRRKMKKLKKENVIKTVRGAGYIIEK